MNSRFYDLFCCAILSNIIYLCVKVKDRSRKQLQETQSEVGRLTAELNKVRKNQENMMRNENRRDDQEWKVKVIGLQQEVRG